MSPRTTVGTLLVLAKQPVAGRVKTRLTPDVTPEQAARLAAAALTDTLRTVDRSPASSRVLVFDGDFAAWVPPGWSAVPQPTGTLDVRLGAAFESVGAGSAVLVGMDTPQLTRAHLAGFDPSRYDACLGPARDGGYWCIGFRDATRAAELIAGVPMSTAWTARAQLQRLRVAGLRVQLLDTLIDVDTVADAAEVAALAPSSRFAREWRRIRPAHYRIAG